MVSLSCHDQSSSLLLLSHLLVQFLSELTSELTCWSADLRLLSCET